MKPSKAKQNKRRKCSRTWRETTGQGLQSTVTIGRTCGAEFGPGPWAKTACPRTGDPVPFRAARYPFDARGGPMPARSDLPFVHILSQSVTSVCRLVPEEGLDDCKRDLGRAREAL